MSTADERRPMDMSPDEHPLDAAKRMVGTDVPRGSIFPSASGPLYWQRAAVIAQVEQAEALRRIAVALEVIAFPAQGRS